MRIRSGWDGCKLAPKPAPVKGECMSALFTSDPMAVEPQWIDYNGHLNMAYYNVLFDRGTDAAFEALGLGPDYLGETGNSFFTAESHVHYLRELKEGERVRVTFHVLDHDAKRIPRLAGTRPRRRLDLGPVRDDVSPRSTGHRDRGCGRCPPFLTTSTSA